MDSLDRVHYSTSYSDTAVQPSGQVCSGYMPGRGRPCGQEGARKAVDVIMYSGYTIIIIQRLPYFGGLLLTEKEGPFVLCTMQTAACLRNTQPADV